MILTAAGLVGAAVLVPWLAAMLGVEASLARGWTVRNYRGVDVALGLGWAWMAWGAGALILGVRSESASGAFRVGLLVVGASFLGLFDDTSGDASAKGLGGHLRAALSGRPTTGLAKALGIPLIALFATWNAPSSVTGAAQWLLAAAVVALTANLVNLLDVRPGRALKSYLVLALPPAVALGLAGLSAHRVVAVDGALAPLLALAPALVCWSADLSERAMLGDMGANAAGALAGWLLARVLPLPGLALAAAALLALNLASERISFSAVIERTAALRWLDGLGRAVPPPEAEGES